MWLDPGRGPSWKGFHSFGCVREDVILKDFISFCHRSYQGIYKIYEGYMIENI